LQINVLANVTAFIINNLKPKMSQICTNCRQKTFCVGLEEQLCECNSEKRFNPTIRGNKFIKCIFFFLALNIALEFQLEVELYKSWNIKTSNTKHTELLLFVLEAVGWFQQSDWLRSDENKTSNLWNYLRTNQTKETRYFQILTKPTYTNFYVSSETGTNPRDQLPLQMQRFKKNKRSASYKAKTKYIARRKIVSSINLTKCYLIRKRFFDEHTRTQRQEVKRITLRQVREKMQLKMDAIASIVFIHLGTQFFLFFLFFFLC
jgi:hypothetical protein